VFPSLLVGLFRAAPDKCFEDVTRLDVVPAVGREIDGGELLDDEVERILVGLGGDLLGELEGLDDGADVRRETVDVVVEIRASWLESSSRPLRPLFSAGLAMVNLERLKNGTPPICERRWQMMFSPLALIVACSLRTAAFVGARMQSKRRRTVSGRMTL
jgi:hypothetical protein